MEERHREKLRCNRVAFIKDLIVNEDLLAHLEQNDILSQTMIEEIEVKPTKQKRASELLNVLTKRGPDAFRVFVDALVCTNQTHLATLLESEIGAQARPKQNEHAGPLRLPSQPMDDTEEGMLAVKIHPVDEIDAAKKINEGDVYPMSSQPRGRAVIISNEHFDRGQANRDGSIYDLINLQELFRQLGFDTVTYSDLTAKAIRDTLEDESRHQQPSANAFFLCILSHGAKGHIFGVDSETISIEQITTMFDGKNCPQLTGKPKLFIIQACQGEDSTRGVPQADSGGGSEDTDMAQRLRELRLGDTADAMPSLPNVHEKADMVLAYSTVTGYKSWRLPESGSWYIRELVKIFANFAYKEHFMDLLVKVQQQVSEKHTFFDKHTSSGLYVQMPETRTTLRKKLYLFPGFYG